MCASPWLCVFGVQAMTATFKLRKVEMVKEGCDPSVIQEPLFFRSDAHKTFIPLDPSLHARILNGQLRV
jgi:fatty-acyl-CoA synthase